VPADAGAGEFRLHGATRQGCQHKRRDLPQPGRPLSRPFDDTVGGGGAVLRRQLLDEGRLAGAAPLLDLRPGEASGQRLLKVPYERSHRNAVEDDVVVAHEHRYAGLIEAANDGETVGGAVG